MKLVCVVGPTGCGKTWLGVELAKALRGEVVSCDSMQIYRGMVIGTAAPTEAETRFLSSLESPRIKGVVGWADLTDPGGVAGPID